MEKIQYVDRMRSATDPDVGYYYDDDDLYFERYKEYMKEVYGENI